MNCKHCGEQNVKMSWDKATIAELEKNEACFTCNYWIEMAERDKKHNRWIVTNKFVHYVIGEGNSYPRGFDGRLFIIKRNGEIVKTNDLWHQGDIPIHLQHLFTINAEFVKEN